MKQGSEDHGKMRMLARLLRIPLPYANGIMERLWNKAAHFRPDGAVGRWSNLEIAEYCAMPIEVDADAFVEALIEARFLDAVTGPNRLLIHDWPEHCTHFTHNKIARQQGYFGDGTKPSLKRLDHRYKSEAESFYGMSAQSWQMSAQSGQMSAQSGQMSAQSETPETPAQNGSVPKTETHKVVASAQSAKLGAYSKAQRARACPTPTPTPTPIEAVVKLEALRNYPEAVLVVDAKHTTAAAVTPNGKHPEFAWPHAAAFVQNKFPRTENAYVEGLAQLAQQTLESLGGDRQRITDDVLADALREATFTRQTSAAGYKRTLPTVIQNWAKPTGEK